MGINWDNIERLRTRDGRKVIGAMPIVHGFEKTWYVVVLSHKNDGVDDSYFVYPNGKRSHSIESPKDIIELPPEPPKPREVVRWIDPIAFSDMNSLACTNKRYGQMVRVRIIEEPEVKDGANPTG